MPSEIEREDDPDDVAIEDYDPEDGDGSEHNVPAAPRTPARPPRQFSAKTRELFKTAAGALKQQIADEDDELYEPLGGDEGDGDPEGDAAGEQSGAAATTTTTQVASLPSAPTTPVQAAAPAAPSLDAAILAERDRLAADRAELERDRRAFEDQRASSALEGFRVRYHENSADAVSSLLKEITGASTDADVRDAVADLVVDLSASVLGVTVSPEVRAATDSRRAIRAVRAHKADARRSEERRAGEQQAAAAAERERVAIGAIGREFAAAAAEFPYLSAEDDPAGFVWDVIKARSAKTGEQLSWRDAAKLAEDSFKRYADAWVAKRRHLIAPPAQPAAAGSQPSNGNGTTRERANQGQARRTVTNDMAASVPTQREAPREEERRQLTNEERRARTKQRMREAWRQTQARDEG